MIDVGKLNAYINKQRQLTLAEDQINCVAFTCGAIKAATGKWPIEIELGNSVAEGRKNMRAAGYRSLDHYMSKNMEQIEPLFAAPGDVALLKDARGLQAVGVVIGSSVAAIDVDGQVTTLSLQCATKVYRPC